MSLIHSYRRTRNRFRQACRDFGFKLGILIAKKFSDVKMQEPQELATGTDIVTAKEAERLFQHHRISINSNKVADVVGNGITNHRNGIKTRPLSSKSTLGEIVWPELDVTDPWKALALRKWAKALNERFTDYGSFSICDLDSFMHEMNISLTPETRVSYGKLRKLHCVKFEDVPTVLYQAIPHLINHIVFEGEVTHPSIQI